ncbi:MAG: carbon starvation protein A [Alphaproteobacteria bacterium GM7ARS4]|nr:carbon starvation protein A [Alphaproteobacteria bacterium GM7ARS4]
MGGWFHRRGRGRGDKLGDVLVALGRAPFVQALLWACVCVLAVWSIATIAFHRGEPINSLWLMVAALCCASLGYRFYSAFIAAKVLALDPSRVTPAVRLEDGHNYVPTNRWVVFGHHFAAIAGPGPLIGPTLAVQFGYLPGTLWILIGAVLGGCVQDMVVLFFSTRRDGRSLGKMARDELGPFVGGVALIGLLVIMVILIAVLGLVVANAMKHSPWATATVALTIPIAILMGFHMRRVRPGRVIEGTLIGVALLLMAVVAGGMLDTHESLRQWFYFDASQIALMLIIYGFFASALPVWLLLAPRDYLSTFMKLGTVVMMACAIIILRPDLHMPALTSFIDGSGPVFAGSVFPFVFITIACGAISGFHALVCSGTTPKMLKSEGDIRFIGYGAMAVEMCVAIMAVIAASVLEPGVYFAINAPSSLTSSDPTVAAAVITGWGYDVSAPRMEELARMMGEETLFARTGGAPSLAVGMATLFSSVTAERLMALWYHFAIMFEALFILTTLDAGTRVGRFMLQDVLAQVFPRFRDVSWTPGALLTSALFCGAWGYFLYHGTLDPLGGINSLWPLFGISNQMLGVMALAICTILLVKHQKARYAWITACPMAWMLLVTTSASWHKVFSDDRRTGFLSHAQWLEQGLRDGSLAPSLQEQAYQLIANDYINTALTLFFVFVTWTIVLSAVKACWRSMATPAVWASPTAPSSR